jgi:hypothetical protein
MKKIFAGMKWFHCPLMMSLGLGVLFFTFLFQSSEGIHLCMAAAGWPLFPVTRIWTNVYAMVVLLPVSAVFTFILVPFYLDYARLSRWFWILFAVLALGLAWFALSKVWGYADWAASFPEPANGTRAPLTQSDYFLRVTVPVALGGGLFGLSIGTTIAAVSTAVFIAAKHCIRRASARCTS